MNRSLHVSVNSQITLFYSVYYTPIYRLFPPFFVQNKAQKIQAEQLTSLSNPDLLCLLIYYVYKSLLFAELYELYNRRTIHEINQSKLSLASTSLYGIS